MAEAAAEERSLAAQCIVLHHCGATFHPVFTHQCFDNECIAGYRPQGQAPLSKSRSVDDATHTISVDLYLSPDGQACAVDLEIAEYRATKRVKTSPSTTVTTASFAADEDSSVELGEDDTDDDDDDLEADDYVDTDEDDEVIERRPQRLEPDEIRGALAKALPDVVESADPRLERYMSQPLGEVVQEYTVNGANFVLSLVHGPAAADYHTKVQRLALWFIETADDVQLDDDWHVLYLWRRHGRSRYSVAGYLTLYRFAAVFRKPRAGHILRICQALVLPPYQRAGHGRRLLEAVYDHAQTQDDIVEINVEDPAPGFVALRNTVDYQRYGARYFGNSTSWEPLAERRATSIADETLLTTRQVHIVYELSRLAAAAADESQMDSFRLMVKKRLNRWHREELGACETKAAMKERLAELYDETLAGYQAILQRNNK